MPDPSQPPSAAAALTLAFQSDGAAPRTVEIPGLPAQAAPAGTLQPSAAQPVTALPGAKAPAPDMTFLFIISGFLVLLIITSVFSGRKEKKRRQELLSALSTNDRVQTVGGILGTIVDLSTDEVTLRVDENTNTRIRFARTAIQQVLRKANAKPDAKSERADKADPVKV